MLPPRADPLLTPTFIRSWPARLISAAARYQYHRIVGSSQSRTMALLAVDYAFGGANSSAAPWSPFYIARCHRYRFDRSRRRQQGGIGGHPLECLGSSGFL